MAKFYSQHPHSTSVCHYVVKNSLVSTYQIEELIKFLYLTYYLLNYIPRYSENAMENIQDLRCLWIIYYCH